eukprot:179476_1
MDKVWIDYIPWVYASIQLTVTIVVSILGAKYVRNEFLLQKNTINNHKQSSTVNFIKTTLHQYAMVSPLKPSVLCLWYCDNKDCKFTEHGIYKNYQIQRWRSSNALLSFVLCEGCVKQYQEPIKASEMEEKEIEIEYRTELHQCAEEFEVMSKMGFCKLWLKVIWKLRHVYCSLVVHVFDVLTDILVIISWLSFPDISGDNINPRVMAKSAIIVLGIHKLVSLIAFWTKERSIIRCLLQVLDLLIFEEIFLTHKKIITQFKLRASKDYYEKEGKQAIETTTTFKYVRNLEAIFESIPQSVCQSVFIMRTGWKSEGSGIVLVISILSILQSIISMTDSILNNDNIYMSLPKWERHKQRLPPTFPFIKHAISRLSEVIYRISLLSLFWTVCGGLSFAILIGVEFIFLAIIVCMFDRKRLSNIDDLILRFQMLIIMPSELVYALDHDGFYGTSSDDDWTHWRTKICIYGCIYTFLAPCTCCVGPATILSTLCFLGHDIFYIHMSVRIGLSMLEWIFVIIWPLIFIDADSYDFLYSSSHGLYVFIVGIVCYLIYSQYLYLFPNFELPHGVPVTSRWGYAFNGELEELQRIKMPKWQIERYQITNWRYNSIWYRTNKEIIIDTEQKYWDAQLKPSSFKPTKMNSRQTLSENERMVASDMKILKEVNKINRIKEGTTLAMFALSNNQHHIVDWLENEKGAKKHKELFDMADGITMDAKFARQFIDPEGTYFESSRRKTREAHQFENVL